ncbi:Imm3 family immunity protein [Chengkuizengella axinellae]|uniref:Imm3 family immunity protein n=1 Tax=Chengkuizengella axinellae TaxID=3064388 RepID=A0ABT9J4P7_9BACL|nr:Imm3 family immunity protein [Chengkuizengella sp. 2205SS18-9]MDP5275909.1 Imm3 family immunity protein [Chengkuizengella sp. 2205SS18-9]
MENWDYNELINVINEAYIDFINEGRGYKHAVARLVDEFNNLGEIEDFIVDTAIGEILITHKKVFVNTLNRIRKNISSFNHDKAKGELTLEEVANLCRRMEKVLEGLDKVEIDYNPNAEMRD